MFGKTFSEQLYLGWIDSPRTSSALEQEDGTDSFQQNDQVKLKGLMLDVVKVVPEFF
jgi:hypothetical protein